MRRFQNLAGVILVAFAVLAFAGPADAQFGKLKDKLKKKTEQKADQKTDETIDKALDGSGTEAAPAEEGGEPTEAAPAPAGGTGATATSEDMTLYTKYDFVPGDKVIFYDDLSREEMGEFPSSWGLVNGVFENAKVAGQNWILCTDRGTIFPKIAAGPLPEKYTVEIEFFSNGGEKDGWYYIHWVNADEEKIGTLQIGYSYMTALSIMNKQLADKEHPGPPEGQARDADHGHEDRRSSATSTRSGSRTYRRSRASRPSSSRWRRTRIPRTTRWL